MRWFRPTAPNVGAGGFRRGETMCAATTTLAMPAQLHIEPQATAAQSQFTLPEGGEVEVRDRIRPVSGSARASCDVLAPGTRRTLAPAMTAGRPGPPRGVGGRDA